MDRNLFETLLQKTESEELDFKSEQYKLDNDEHKSEFIKDILAFANSWKVANAYIICGVSEENGRAKKLIGIDSHSHLQDNNLQQLVCSKTNRPPNFRYEPFTYKGKEFGIIIVGKHQPRPVFLTKDYGRLKKQTVYIRRGSSTGIANVEEIAKMVSEKNLFNELNIYLRNKKNNTILDTNILLESVILNFITPDKTKNIEEQKPQDINPELTEINAVLNNFKKSISVSMFRFPSNSDYLNELKDYHLTEKLLTPISFIVENTGSSVANDVKTVVTIKKMDSLGVFLYYDILKPPSKQGKTFLDVVNLSFDKKPIEDITYREDKHNYIFTVRFKKIQPKDQLESNGFLYIGASKRLEFEMLTKTFADNLPEPIEKSFNFKIELDEENFELEEV